MKKLILVVLLLGAGWFAWRTMRQGGEAEKPAVKQTDANAPAPIPQKEAISGATLNKAFPTAGEGYSLVFTQEKDGFAQADLSQNGKKLAALTVSDTDANPSARTKFKGSSKQIAGFPVAPVGAMGTAVLVGDRYQVQVRSSDASFTAADREAWLAKFKLAELAAVKE